MAYQLEIPVTFRAADTNLSGKVITDSALVLLVGNWTSARLESNGKQIAFEPGVVGALTNEFLNSFGRIIGHDPASIDSVMIGRIAATTPVVCAVGAISSVTALSTVYELFSQMVIFWIQTTLKAVDVLVGIIVNYHTH